MPAKTAVLGFGNQGAAQAHCLRASGWPVVVGARPGNGADRAREAGFELQSLKEATASSEVVAVLLPDEVVSPLFQEQLGEVLRPGQTFVFAHGFSLLYGDYEWPAGVDVILVSPTSPGSVLREEFEAGRGVPAYLAVHQDASGQAWQRAEEYARGIGSDRVALHRTTVREEVEVDLFGEQAVLVGGMLELVSASVGALTRAGYAPEIAYLECAHQLKFLADLLHRVGPEAFLEGISATARYGALTRGPRVVGPETRRELDRMLGEIRDGAFAREFLEDQSHRAEHLLRLHQSAILGRLSRLEEARSKALPKPTPETPGAGPNLDDAPLAPELPR